jgi:hypothetical protein
MTTINSEAILQDGAVLTKGTSVVNLELDGDLGLFFMSQVCGILDTDRAAFESGEERDEALLNTVRLYLAEGWQLAEENA